MKKQYFSLDLHESNRLTKMLQVVFGIICIIVAAAWLIMNLKASGNTFTLWVTILFLSGFGYYQINAGLGFASRFIEISAERIRLKANSVLPIRHLNAADLTKIEIFPLSVVFLHKQGKKVVMRFGTTFTDNITHIKDRIAEFAVGNDIDLEIKTEEF